MKLFLKSTMTIFFLLLSVNILYAQQQNIVPLYQVTSGMEKTNDMPDYQSERSYISLNNNILQKGFLKTGDRISLPSKKVSGIYRINRISNYSEETYSVIASGENGSNRVLSFTVQGKRIMGNIHLHNQKERYHLAWDSKHRSNYLATIETSELDALACTADQNQEVGAKINPNLQPGATDISNDEHVAIDLMIVYTRNARDFMENESSTNLYISEIVNRSQMALDNSEIQINLNLVRAMEVNYNEDPQNSNQTLYQLTDPYDGYMDEIHQARKDYKADMVTMFAEIEDTGGLGWILDNSSGAPDFAFSLSRVQQLQYTYTMIHELGHNMGNSHSRNQSSSAAPQSGGLNEYSTGWRWVGDDGQGYASVMTYGEGDEEVAYFSNPDVTYKGVPTGSYSGQYAPADNARSMNEIRGVIADYQSSPMPVAPTPQSPQDQQKNVDPVTELSWSESVRANSYRAQLATSSEFNDPLIDETVSASSTSFQPSDSLDYLTTYYWRVQASNENGTSSFSSTYSFQTVIEPPENVVTLTPSNSAIQIPVSPEFSWELSDRAAQYNIQVAAESDFSSTVIDTETNGTSFTPDRELEYAKEYYWRIQAENAGGKSDFSDPVKFTTEVDQTEITMNYPNPFQNNTTIRYQLANEGDVLLEVYNTAGRKIRTLVNSHQTPRIYNHSFSGSGLASGTYIIRLIAEEKSYIQMMTLIK